MISKQQKLVASNTTNRLSDEWGDSNLITSVNQEIEKSIQPKPPSTEECIDGGIISIAGFIVAVSGVALQAYDIFVNKNGRKPTSEELNSETLSDLNSQLSSASAEVRKKSIRITKIVTEEVIVVKTDD